MKLLTDALQRKRWIVEGLVQNASKSFWAPYTGNTADSIVYQSTSSAAKHGHETTFDFKGNITGNVVKGKDTAYGKGETKKKFSSTIRVQRYRIPVDNGDAFDGKEYGDLEINEHSDSRSKLSDLFIRFKDQIIFDAVQGNLQGDEGKLFAPTHHIDLNGLTYNNLVDIETTLKTSVGYQAGAEWRSPLRPFRMMDGKPMWLFIVDAFTARVLKQDPQYQTIVINADLRGNKNRAISGVIGKLGNMVIVEADNFFGSTSPGASWKIEDTGIEIAGLRNKDENDVWSGQEGYDPATELTSRCVVVGAGAVQFGFGMHPDYKFKSSQDFDITSESALVVVLNAQKTKLINENGDYSMAKVTDNDWGVVTVDITHA